MVFQTNPIPILDWAARPPDLNIIENVLWGLHAVEVYKDSKQYYSAHELNQSVLDVWARIPHGFKKKGLWQHNSK